MIFRNFNLNIIFKINTVAEIILKPSCKISHNLIILYLRLLIEGNLDLILSS